MDFAAARRKMVASQVRTNRVTDPLVSSAMEAVPREYFVPAGPAEGFSSSGSPPIAVDDLSNLIATGNRSASWSTPQATADNDVNNPTWGAIGGVHPDAQLIWHDALYDSSSSDGRYVVFRSVATVDPIPEPETWAMLLAGLGLVLGTACGARLHC